MADFVFAPGAEEGDFRAGGYGWQLDWLGSRPTKRMIEAAKCGIDAANNAAADQARNVHPWDDQTFQTRDAVFVGPAVYHRAKKQIWGVWGVRDYPREPLRVQGPDGNYPEYEGRTLSTKDVALLLEFGFHTRGGGYRQYRWLYPAWDAERATVMARVKECYARSAPSGPRIKAVYVSPAGPPGTPHSRVGRSSLGTFIPLGPYYTSE